VTLDDHALAAQLATDAGELLLRVRVEGLEGKALKDEGDRRANELLLARLAEHRPADAVLSEESADSPARLTADRVWIIDPLDGTREFSEPDRPDWAVHVALVEDGALVAGAVALPAQGRTLATADPAPTPGPGAGPIRLLVSRTRPSEHAAALAAALGAELVPMGSAGAKAMAVVSGAADVYAHSGGQFEWDSAAPVAVAAAAGLHASRLDGSPLVYNQPDPWLPDLLVCRPDLAGQVLDALDRIGVPTTER
jgi:3'(2'), 5'-bisphosphate nucleotidase